MIEDGAGLPGATLNLVAIVSGQLYNLLVSDFTLTVPIPWRLIDWSFGDSSARAPAYSTTRGSMGTSEKSLHE